VAVGQNALVCHKGRWQCKPRAREELRQQANVPELNNAVNNVMNSSARLGTRLVCIENYVCNVIQPGGGVGAPPGTPAVSGGSPVTKNEGGCAAAQGMPVRLSQQGVCRRRNVTCPGKQHVG